MFVIFGVNFGEYIFEGTAIFKLKLYKILFLRQILLGITFALHFCPLTEHNIIYISSGSLFKPPAPIKTIKTFSLSTPQGSVFVCY